MKFIAHAEESSQLQNRQALIPAALGRKLRNAELMERLKILFLILPTLHRLCKVKLVTSIAVYSIEKCLWFYYLSNLYNKWLS